MYSSTARCYGADAHLRQKLRQQKKAVLHSSVIHRDDAGRVERSQTHVEGRQASEATSALHVAWMLYKGLLNDVQHHELRELVLPHQLCQCLTNLQSIQALSISLTSKTQAICLGFSALQSSCGERRELYISDAEKL